MIARDTGASAALIAALREPRCYAHPVERVELLETHISWVLLTGTYAYKLKKPLDLGFLDFGTLAARKRACEEELRLNRRTAPQLYLDVVPVTGTVDKPVVGGLGSPIEYVVQMREFPQAALLTNDAARGALPIERMDELATAVAAFHAAIDRAGPQSPFTPHEVIGQARQNFAQMRALAVDASTGQALARLAAWTEREFAERYDTFVARHRDGFVRECHGDLHLRNLVALDGRIVPFDCIEFNAAFRWIDVMSEIAFLVMDLADHMLPRHAWRFLDAYLEEAGDYGGLAVLRFYLVYRALVRAKIAGMRVQQLPAGAPERATAERELRAYLALADEFAGASRRALMITRGLSGSGKTVFSGLVVTELGTIRVRSDIERKRLHGVATKQRTRPGVGQSIYAADATQRTYASLQQIARIIVAAGFPAVVDATFLLRTQRDALRGLAREIGVPFAIAVCEAPEAVLRARIAARARSGTDASEATLDVLARQIATAEPIGAEEYPFAVQIDTQSSPERLRGSALALGARLGVGPRPAAPARAAV